MAYKSLIDYYGGGMVKPSQGYQLGGLIAGADGKEIILVSLGVYSNLQNSQQEGNKKHSVRVVY